LEVLGDLAFTVASCLTAPHAAAFRCGLGRSGSSSFATNRPPGG
jgi:hypothetical protein